MLDISYRVFLIINFTCSSPDRPKCPLWEFYWSSPIMKYSSLQSFWSYIPVEELSPCNITVALIVLPSSSGNVGWKLSLLLLKPSDSRVEPWSQLYNPEIMQPHTIQTRRTNVNECLFAASAFALCSLQVHTCSACSEEIYLSPQSPSDEAHSHRWRLPLALGLLLKCQQNVRCHNIWD